MLFHQTMGALQFGDEIPVSTSKIFRFLGNPADMDSMWFPISLDEYKQIGVTHYAYIPGQSEVEGLDAGFIYWHAPDAMAYHWPLLAPCLETGTTTYDDFVKNQPKIDALPIDNSTLLLVIDMQNDFVTGSFKMPCANKIDYLTLGIANLIEATSRRGGTVIASMDYHSPSHCSFKGKRNEATNEILADSETCHNEVFVTEADKGMGRYHNMFPPHTQYDEIRGERGVPTYPMFGAKLEPRILHALGSAAETAESNGDRKAVEIVFKGFNERVDSFSAMQHLSPGNTGTDLNEEDFTGAFALMEGTPQHCFSESPAFDCFPTRAQLDEPSTEMRSMTQIIRRRLEERSIKQILVTGLVFDFCVKETAIYTKMFVDHLFPPEKRPRVMIPMDLARPAMEGLPGVAGPLASMDYLISSSKDMRDAGVELVQVAA